MAGALQSDEQKRRPRRVARRRRQAASHGSPNRRSASAHRKRHASARARRFRRATLTRAFGSGRVMTFMRPPEQGQYIAESRANCTDLQGLPGLAVPSARPYRAYASGWCGRLVAAIPRSPRHLPSAKVRNSAWALVLLGLRPVCSLGSYRSQSVISCRIGSAVEEAHGQRLSVLSRSSSSPPCSSCNGSRQTLSAFSKAAPAPFGVYIVPPLLWCRLRRAARRLCARKSSATQRSQSLAGS